MSVDATGAPGTCACRPCAYHAERGHDGPHDGTSGTWSDDHPRAGMRDLLKERADEVYENMSPEQRVRWIETGEGWPRSADATPQEDPSRDWRCECGHLNLHPFCEECGRDYPRTDGGPEGGEPPVGSRLWRCEHELKKARTELQRLHWLRDVVGVDIELMFARAQKENDGREQRRERATPALNVARTEGGNDEVCLEWWRGEEKFTFYAEAVDVIRVAKDGKVEDSTIEDMAAWLKEG